MQSINAPRTVFFPCFLCKSGPCCCADCHKNTKSEELFVTFQDIACPTYTPRASVVSTQQVTHDIPRERIHAACVHFLIFIKGDVNPTVWREGVVGYISPQIFEWCILFFNERFFASKAHASTKQVARFLGHFVASFLATAINTPNFTSLSSKKFELHILAPLSIGKNLQELWNSAILNVVYCTYGCWKLQT